MTYVDGALDGSIVYVETEEQLTADDGNTRLDAYRVYPPGPGQTPPQTGGQVPAAAPAGQPDGTAAGPARRPGAPARAPADAAPRVVARRAWPAVVVACRSRCRAAPWCS